MDKYTFGHDPRNFRLHAGIPAIGIGTSEVRKAVHHASECLPRLCELRQSVFLIGDLTMSVGTVKWFNPQKGYGFIEPDEGGRDVFVHITAVEAAGLSTLQEGQRVNFEIGQDRPGKTSAKNLTLAE